MKKFGNRFLNVLLVTGLLGIAVFVCYYYFSYWQASTVKVSTVVTIDDETIELPPGHPKVAQQKNLKFPAEGKYCLSCHQGIEPARPLDSKMMQEILAKGALLGDPNGCVVCHGGNPMET